MKGLLFRPVSHRRGRGYDDDDDDGDDDDDYYYYDDDVFIDFFAWRSLQRSFRHFRFALSYQIHLIQ